MLSIGNCLASENTIYVINNNAPNYSSGYGYGGGTMCTRHGGICTNGYYAMSSGRVVYAPTQWKRQTLRERRLSSGYRNVAYYQ